MQRCCKAAAKKEISGSSKWLHSTEMQSTGFIKDSRKSGTSQKVHNRKADCCTLLKRITELKSVNLEFKSVNAHPEKGCLQWLHGTMSEPPWKSH